MNHILAKTFENEFKEDNYKDLVVNLFNRFDFSKEQSLKQYFTDDEKQKIKDFTYLGTYEDIEKKSLDVLIVELKGGSKVERARSLQRNLIGKYLKGNLKDSAIVAFYSKDNPDWRLSFVKMDYKIGDRGAKVEIGTPPKRYSFLVGKTEPSYTAKKQLQPIISSDVTPTVLDVEKAFSIEKVTKEFYNKIAEMFTKLVGGERKIGSKKITEKGCLEFPPKDKDNDTIKKEFAVRLIGRLLFCWFLKKKKSEAGKPLLTSVLISSDAVRQENDYYHRFLEPLFFQVLNTHWDKRKKHFKQDFWSGIPFLNGGLFEPHVHDYCPIDSMGELKPLYSLKIPDEWFLELFKVFELYNFTIDESSTIDIEISVDPEMLGRIFENLLAEINPETGETARKSTGSYYTPRPIVEYMVDESLKQYLKTQLTASKPVIPALSSVIPAKAGIHVSQEKMDSPVKPENDDIDAKLSALLSYGEEPLDLSEPEKDAIIDALDRVKIIDPACGSGAFPMGILHKMLLILQKIDPKAEKWISRKIRDVSLRKTIEKKLKNESWDYFRKRGIIRDSIYGVDIQLIAVEISRLRFFLSLVVDEIIDDAEENRGIEALPNLEFKFVAANSLIGLPQFKKEETIGLSEATQEIQKLRELREAYFTAYGDEKRRIEKEFSKTQDRMFNYAREWMYAHKKSLESQTLELSKWEPFSDKTSSWFDPEWMFGIKNPSPLAGEGKGEGGFDIVIANPPYVSHVNYPQKDKEIILKLFTTFKGRADIYVAFYEKGIELLKNKGCLVYISPNKFFRAGYGTALRQYLNNKTRLISIVDFGDSPIFDATTYPCIVHLEKGQSHKYSFSYLKTASTYIDNDSEQQYEKDYLINEIWSFEDSAVASIWEKLQTNSIALEKYIDKQFYRGIVTGLNDAFVINAKQRSDLISTNPKIAEIIKPYLRGKDVKRWYSRSNDYVIFTYHGIDIRQYPEVLDYLRPFKSALEKRATATNHAWYELQQPQTGIYHQFEKIKIISTDIAKRCEFTIDNSKSYIDATIFCIPIKDLYLLSILNSSLIEAYYKSISSTIRGDFLRFKKIYAYRIPIKKIPIEKRQPFITLVDRILSAKQNNPSADTSVLEREIDRMVYALYGLAPEEIEIVERNG